MVARQQYVLVIESYESLRGLICKILGDKYNILEAATCAQAIKASEGKDIKVIFCDIDTIDIKDEKVKKHFFECRDKNFILTGTEIPEKDIFDFPIKYHFLKKPYNPEELMNLIELTGIIK